MSKTNSLKDSMKGGLNGLLTSTAPSVKEAQNKAAEQQTAEPSKKREPAVHCNFVIDKSIHTRMKYLAIDKGMALRDIVNEAMRQYLEQNGR